MNPRIHYGLVLALGIAGVQACDTNEGPAGELEEAGEAVEETVEEAGDEIEDAGDEIEDAADEAQ